MRYYALLTTCGTACAETALTESEYNDPALRAAVERQIGSSIGPDAPIPGTWTDVTDNDAINPELSA